MFHRTLSCLRRAKVTIPQLSPTHTRAKIVDWCLPESLSSPVSQRSVQSYDPVFIVQCTPDLVTEGYRESIDHEPLMIVEVHEEGVFTLKDGIELDQWYDCGVVIGEVFDGDEDPDYDGDWLWQAYSYTVKEK